MDVLGARSESFTTKRKLSCLQDVSEIETIQAQSCLLYPRSYCPRTFCTGQFEV